MRCLLALSLFIAVHWVTARIDDENSLNEIPYKNSTLESEVDIDDNTSSLRGNDLEEVSVFVEESSYEEINLRSMSNYIQTAINSRNDESDSHVSNKDAFKRNKEDSPQESSQSKSKKRKKREASCTNTDQPTFNCDAQSKYRTINGACNNLKHPEWGMSMGCQERLLQANYEGETDLRISVKGGPLPAPRNLSLRINTNESHPERKRNHLFVFFGQFIAHDMVLTPFFREDTGEVLPCCQPNLENDPNKCVNVYAQKDDPFYGPLDHLCQDLPRSIPCSGCDKKGRKLTNANTAFFDCSPIYGSSENISMSLRRNDGTGKLISQMTSTGELLSNSSNPRHDQCSFPDKDLLCFQGGEQRVNQHLMLTCLHTIFLREHNRIASKLKEINPSWDEEKLFQETRRIVGAKMQVIVYKEYLPIVFSPRRMLLYGLSLSKGFTRYDDTLNPTISIEFSTAAFRIIHSSINTVVSKKPRLVTENFEWMRDLYSLPFGLRKGGFGPLIEDTTTVPAQLVDRFAVEDTSNYLYRAPFDPGGLDLQAIDIQRGRDNGLPTYVQVVKYCHKVEIKSFEDPILLLFMRLSDVKVLKNNYKSIEDVDLQTALQMEIKEFDSVFGPTSACIVANQFRNIKYGDRFYFEHINQAGSFTIGQRNELRKASLTQIICKNVDGVSYLPENAMLFAIPLLNRNVNCKDIKDLDYSKWKGE